MINMNRDDRLGLLEELYEVFGPDSALDEVAQALRSMAKNGHDPNDVYWLMEAAASLEGMVVRLKPLHGGVPSAALRAEALRIARPQPQVGNK